MTFTVEPRIEIGPRCLLAHMSSSCVLHVHSVSSTYIYMCLFVKMYIYTKEHTYIYF